jgi:hypothetical protein
MMRSWPLAMLLAVLFGSCDRAEVMHRTSGADTTQHIPATDTLAVALDTLDTDAMVQMALAGAERNYFESFVPLSIALSDTDHLTLVSVLSDSDATWLGHRLPLACARRIFPYPLDTIFVDGDQVQVSPIFFDGSPAQPNRYALVIGSEYGSWEVDIYFIASQRIVGFIHNYHHYGMQAGHFMRADGTVIFHHVECLGSGTGIWQFNRHFYSIGPSGMRPVLNIMERANLNGWSSPRNLWYHSELVSTDPLCFRYVHHTELVNVHYQEAPLVADSGSLHLRWDPIGQVYAPVFGMGLLRSEYAAYHLDAPHALAAKVFQKRLVHLLQSKDTVAVSGVRRFMGSLADKAD